MESAGPNTSLQRTAIRRFAASAAAELSSFGVERSRFSGMWLCVVLASTSAVATAGQSQASYEAAIRNDSTAPSYVLVTIVNDRQRVSRTGCNTANLLLGAIHIEYSLPYDEAGLKKGISIALGNQDHVFHFSKRAAIDNFPIYYSSEDLSYVRSRLAALSSADLRKGFEGDKPLRTIYEVKPWKRHQALRDATACVLVERGFSVGMGDFSDDLWIAR